MDLFFFISFDFRFDLFLFLFLFVLDVDLRWPHSLTPDLAERVTNTITQRSLSFSRAEEEEKVV